MEIKQYLENKIILDNFKEYLKVLNFLTQYNELLNIVDNYKPELIKANQNIITTENKVILEFEISYYSDKKDYVGWDIHSPMKDNSVELAIVLINDKVSKIIFNLYDNSFLEKNIIVYPQNNNVRKVIEYFKKDINRKKRESYYIKTEMVASSTYNIKWKEFESKFCVEKALNPAYGYWYHDTYYERDYYDETCYIQKYHQDKEMLSHNQFDKKYNGVLKRVRRLGIMKENS